LIHFPDLTKSTLNLSVSALAAALVEQTGQETTAQLEGHAAEIAQKDFKIQALNQKLANYKRTVRE
jgi:hypothetical protein